MQKTLTKSVACVQAKPSAHNVAEDLLAVAASCGVKDQLFEKVRIDDRTLCYGLFGDEDTLLSAETRPVFEQHYPGMSRTFPGGHRLNADTVAHVLLPFIHSLNVI